MDMETDRIICFLHSACLQANNVLTHEPSTNISLSSRGMHYTILSDPQKKIKPMIGKSALTFQRLGVY